MSNSRLGSRVAFAGALCAGLALTSSAYAGGDGRLLVIYDGTFQDEVQAYVDWKVANDPGLDGVAMVDVATTGTAPIDATDIDAYIDSYVSSHADLAYVLLVGDELSVPPTWEPDATNPGNTIASDYPYSNLDADDEPELAVGRIIPKGPGYWAPYRHWNLEDQFAKIEAQHQVAVASAVYDEFVGAADFVDSVNDAEATVGTVTFKANGVTTAGAAGNGYRIRYYLPSTTGAGSLITNTFTRTIQVNLARTSSGAIATTADDVVAAISASPLASSLVTATAVAGQGTAIQPPTAWVSLTGGADSDGAPGTSLVEATELAMLHLEDLGKNVTRAYNATSIDANGNVLPGGVAPTYIDEDSTVRIADLNPAIAYTPGGFDWSADAADVSAAFAAGVETVVYMGHGSFSGWVSPHFATDDADALINTNYPVVFNFACSTGDYAGHDSLAEALLQNSAGGASAMFSSTSVVVAGGIQLADYMDGLIDSIDDDYEPAISHAGEDLHRLGDRLVYLKKFIIARYDRTNENNLHDHLYQFTLFGDPSMRYRPVQ
jgi:hypothetical protein